MPYVGIRVLTPFRGMLRSGTVFKEARDAITEAGIETLGHGFLRLDVIIHGRTDRPEGQDN